MTTRLPFGLMNTHNAVFVGFFVQSRLYQGYPHVSRGAQDREHTQILLLMRWDGRLGFPGGRVDEGEDLIEAALREVQEEINFFNIGGESNADRAQQRAQLKQRLNPIGSHELRPGFSAHFLSCEITISEREYIRSNGHLAPHAHAEVAGINFVHCFDLPAKGISSLLKRGLFAPGVQEELQWLLETHNIDVFTLSKPRVYPKR